MAILAEACFKNFKCECEELTSVCTQDGELIVIENMVNLVAGLPIGRCPSKFMNVTMWEHCTLDSKIFGCGKVDYSDSNIITNFM
jgi:hypothetical protein